MSVHLALRVEVSTAFLTFLNNYNNTLTKDGCGGPIISYIKRRCSDSDSPGNNGVPVKSSDKMHPKLHMSIEVS